MTTASTERALQKSKSGLGVFFFSGLVAVSQMSSPCFFRVALPWHWRWEGHIGSFMLLEVWCEGSISGWQHCTNKHLHRYGTPPQAENCTRCVSEPVSHFFFRQSCTAAKLNIFSTDMDVVGESHEIYAAKNRNEAACEKCVSVSHIRGGWTWNVRTHLS